MDKHKHLEDLRNTKTIIFSEYEHKWHDVENILAKFKINVIRCRGSPFQLCRTIQKFKSDDKVHVILVPSLDSLSGMILPCEKVMFLHYHKYMPKPTYLSSNIILDDKYANSIKSLLCDNHVKSWRNALKGTDFDRCVTEVGLHDIVISYLLFISY